MEKKKEKVILEKNKILMEKEFLLRKISNFKHTIDNKYLKTFEENGNNEDDYTTGKNSCSPQESGRNYVIDDIHSDYERANLHDENSSNNTSLDSNITDNIRMSVSNAEVNKDEYKKFLNLFLKLKFKKTNKLTKGVKFSDPSELWKDLLSNKISKNDWKKYIEEKMMINLNLLKESSRCFKNSFQNDFL